MHVVQEALLRGRAMPAILHLDDLAVGEIELGNVERIADPRSFETPWSNVAQLPTSDLDRMQQILTERGYYHDKIDGKAGMLTRAALGEYQKRNGLKVDCWPSASVLRQMEANGR